MPNARAVNNSVDDAGHPLELLSTVLQSKHPYQVFHM